MIGIGIDTGGTCTDAVIIDTTDHRVLSYGKTLTTKNDLKEGILKALSELDQELVKKARYLSLSTTLATNACVEGKGGRAKLVFFGVKKALVEKMRGTYGLPDPSEICFLSGDAGRDESEENRPDWKAFRREVRESFADFDSVALVQINPKYNDGAYEKKGEEIVREELGIPCVRGYDLYQEV
ncbi:MAG: hydantoinase/oxoprolinase N-terminal domain-containing protein, partial [Anaerovoracaceae bacterium]